MPRGLRYIFVSVVVVLLIILAILLLNRGGSKTPVRTPKAVVLSELANEPGTSVQYIVEGPINASENHRTMQILVSSDHRILNIFQGYQGQLVSSQTLSNDNQAYSAFLDALNRAGFTKKRAVANDNSSSICPTGQRANYIAARGGDLIQNHWAGSCVSGTYAGNLSLTATLFQTQIPNYSQITGTVNLGATSGSNIL